VDTITTTLKREWFAKIVDGSRRVEYREIKPYWTQRLKAVTPPFRRVLRNGMNLPVPVVTVRIDRIVPSPKGRPQAGCRQVTTEGGSILAISGAGYRYP